MSPRLPVPKYHQVYLVLRQHLDEGRYAGGVPGELALTREFGVARVTVRRALEQLAAEGRITRSPGRGTAVVAPAPGAGTTTAAQPPLTGLLENIVHMSLRTTVQVIDCQVLAASDAVARRLELPENAQKRAEVSFRREADAVKFTIRDQGDGFDWKAFQEFDPARAFEPNGRGIALARQLCFADLEYLGNGNELRFSVSVSNG